MNPRHTAQDEGRRSSVDSQRPRIRKQAIGESAETARPGSGAIDVATQAVIHYSSEDPEHPIDNICDGRDGPGGTRWQAASENTTETIVLAFDQPRTIHRLQYEVAEPAADRAQEIRIEVSTDGGQTYQTAFTQEYNFSPNGATFQAEDLGLQRSGVTHLRLTIVPSKRGSGRATLTALRLFER